MRARSASIGTGTENGDAVKGNDLNVQTGRLLLPVVWVMAAQVVVRTSQHQCRQVMDCVVEHSQLRCNARHA